MTTREALQRLVTAGDDYLESSDPDMPSYQRAANEFEKALEAAREVLAQPAP